MLNVKNKELLWSVIEKYDGVSNKHVKFCDSLSNFIKGTFKSDDILTIYLNSNIIDDCDRNIIEQTIGGYIDYHLFSI